MSFRLAGPTGLEPATSGVTGRRSNRLNYDPASVLLLTPAGGTAFPEEARIVNGDSRGVKIGRRVENRRNDDLLREPGRRMGVNRATARRRQNTSASRSGLPAASLSEIRGSGTPQSIPISGSFQRIDRSLAACQGVVHL